MRGSPLVLSLLPLSLAALVHARLHHSLVPEDPFAFPKYRVTFLNGRPVLNETAQRWFQDGLRGGELEFLDQPWEDDQRRIPPLQSIEGSDTQESLASQPDAPTTLSYRLERMKLGPRASYVCLIPPPPDDPGPLTEEDTSTDLTPGHTWSLLQPLAGTCLYHKQGWFTYAYCHNSHVRQFHELVNPQAQRIGEYRPEEDTEWEAYTLGRAPPTLDPGADLTVAEEAALAANVELARGSGSRYLVQRWGDGTYCDKTGKKREVEVQFHCSMTMTDTILFVKETQTCHYVIHIATPRLCGEPGFKSRLDAREEALIRCREILDADAYQVADRSLRAADHPFKMPKRSKPAGIAPGATPAPTPGNAKKKDNGKDDGDSNADSKKTTADSKKGPQDLIRRALERLMGASNGELKPGEIYIEPLGEDDEEVIIEFIEAELDEEDGGALDSEKSSSGDAKEHPSIEEVLRAAGYQVKGEKKKDEKPRSNAQTRKQPARDAREEL